MGDEPSRKRFPEKLKCRRLRKERMDAGILPVKILSATDRLSKLGKYFRKFKFPENLLDETSRIRRRMRDDNSEGTSPEKRLFPRSRISSFRQSTIWEGILSTSLLFERESSLSSVSLPIAGDKTPVRCLDLKMSLVILRT